jgi:hypothetical protein
MLIRLWDGSLACFLTAIAREVKRAKARRVEKQWEREAVSHAGAVAAEEYWRRLDNKMIMLNYY